MKDPAFPFTSVEAKAEALCKNLKDQDYKEKAYEILFNQFLKKHNISICHKKNRADCFKVWRAMIGDIESTKKELNEIANELQDCLHLITDTQTSDTKKNEKC